MSDVVLMLLALIGLVSACAVAAQDPPPAPPAGLKPAWAIAIHGGAGTIAKTMPEPDQKAYLASLREALDAGKKILEEGGTALDAVEKVVRRLEDDPKFNAGKGAVYDHEGGHELDAAIMDGRTLACGAVGAVRTVKNPVSLARLVMEKTPHVLLIGDGAEKFAVEAGVERVDPAYFDTPYRYEQWQKVLKSEQQKGATKPADAEKHGTVGAVALDRHGDLAAATSTGGLTNKRYGRIGDTPVIGAGTYADNRTCAVSGTGIGEEFIRHAVGHDLSALMAYRGWTLRQAAEEIVLRTLRPNDGGLIAVDRTGNIVLLYNTEGMYRAAADASGRLEAAIW